MSKKEPEFESNAITVVVRSRPFNAREVSMKAKPCLEFRPDGKSIAIFEKGVPSSLDDPNAPNKSHDYTFDYAYDSDVPQDQVFIDVGQPVLNASLKGFNTCIFAYGQTGSGKSFAMMGPNGGRDSTKAPGLIPRLCTHLFEEVESRLATNAAEREAAGDVPEHEKPPREEIRVDVQYIEIYQEKVKCLINPKKDNLKVRNHPTMGVYVDNLTEMGVKTYDEVFKLIDEGNAVRQIASTNMNDQSSRSHAIFVVLVTQKRVSRTKDGTETTTERKAKINLVDLAGSERAKSTGASGETLKEGAQINKSLSVLGLVISGLAEASKNPEGKKPFIPFRDSTLTFLLKESLGGNSKTFMLSTMSPASVNADETLSTLRYADRAKAIVTKACVNENATDKKIRELEEEVQKLQEALKRFEEREAQNKAVGAMVPKLALPGGKAKPTMPKPELQKVGGPRGGEPDVKDNGRGRRHHYHHKDLPPVTPRSAIDHVVTVDEVREGDSDPDGDLDDTPLMDSTLRFPDDVAEARHQLEVAEALKERLSLSETVRDAEKMKELAERAEVIPQTVKASREDPYILNLDRCGDWVMTTLVAETTIFGCGPPPDEQVINCQYVTLDEAPGIGPQHCMLIRNSITNQVTLRPCDGYETFGDPPDEPLVEDLVLSSGTSFFLGEELFGFKFDDPADKPMLTSRRRMQSSVRLTNSVRPGADGSGPPTPLSQSPKPVVPGLALGGASRRDPNMNTNLTPPSSNPPSGSGTPTSEPLARPAVPSLRIGGGAAPGPSVSASGHLTPPAAEQPKVPSLQLGTRKSVQGEDAERPSGPIRTPRLASARAGSVSGGLKSGTSEDSTCQFKHTFIFLGKPGVGKTATRQNLIKEDKWLSGFFNKSAPATQPTFGVDSSKINAGGSTKAEISLMELSGHVAFTTLEQLLPDRRVTFVVCFKLTDAYDLTYFRNYIEFALCHSPTQDTTIVLLGTHRDEARATDKNVVDALADIEAQVTSFTKVLQPNEARRPRIVAKFAISNKNRSVVSPSQKITKIPELLSWFADHAVTRCKVDQDFPHGMVPVRVMTLARKLSELRSQGKWILPTSEYKALARIIDTRYEKQLSELHKHTQLLHAWGFVHHHYRHMTMKRSIVVDTDWVYRVIGALSCCIDCVTSSGSASTSVSAAARAALMSQEGSLLRARIGLFAPAVEVLGDQLPFSLPEVMRHDPNGLVCRGVLLISVAIELFRSLMREKNIAMKHLDAVLELLESYDMIVKGSRLKQWFMTHQALHSSHSAMEEPGNDSMVAKGIVDNYDDELEGDEDEEEEFYLVPSCFQAQLPQPLLMHVAPILFGPSYRFSLNMVPPFFFSRFVCRIARYAQKLYAGPVQINKEEGKPPVTMANMWGNALWVIDSSSARAFVRMVNKSLFITFHDIEDESPFHSGLLEVVRCLVHESPGMSCEEAVLCRRMIIDGAPVNDATIGSADGDTGEERWVSVTDNVNSLEKIREREELALRSARGQGPMRDERGMPIDQAMDDGEEALEIVRAERDSFDSTAVFEKIQTDCFVEDELMQRIQSALRLVKKGRSLFNEDPERASKIDGAGMDQLVDALAHVQ